MSGAFALVGLFSAWWIHSKTNNTRLAAGVFFFFTMEFLQFIQYFFLATGLTDPVCNTAINQVLTLLGFIHICLQPYFCHLINSSLTKSCKYLDRYEVILRLCLLGGFALFMRWPLSYIPSLNTMDLDHQESTEWLRGQTLCTFKTESMVHLGWSVPMSDPMYLLPGAFIHAFLMYAPFLALYEKKGMVVQGIFLLLTGPVMAGFITKNLMEQASIWCFFSIAQISTMLFLIRETLLIEFGKEGQVSVLKGQRKEELTYCRDFINCRHCKKVPGIPTDLTPIAVPARGNKKNL